MIFHARFKTSDQLNDLFVSYTSIMSKAEGNDKKAVKNEEQKSPKSTTKSSAKRDDAKEQPEQEQDIPKPAKTPLAKQNDTKEEKQEKQEQDIV